MIFPFLLFKKTKRPKVGKLSVFSLCKRGILPELLISKLDAVHQVVFSIQLINNKIYKYIVEK